MTSDPNSTDGDELDLITGLERTMRLLAKRVYGPSVRAMAASSAGPFDAVSSGSETFGGRLDRGSIIVLATLEERGRLRPSDLAAIVDLDVSTVSRHVSHFERLGLIVREPDPVDRRASQLSITPAGRSGLATIKAARSRLLDAVFASWSPADRDDFQRLLTRLISNLIELPSPSVQSEPSSSTPADPATQMVAKIP